MKTPEEIAAEVATEFPGLNESFMKVFQGWIASAIKSDRFQRADPTIAELRDTIYQALRERGEGAFYADTLANYLSRALRAADEVRRNA